MKFKEIIEEKKEWYALQNAVKKLPKDYVETYKNIVLNEIKKRKENQ